MLKAKKKQMKSQSMFVPWSINIFLFSLQAPFQEIQELDTLGERLLCVETSETSVETVRMVAEVVSSFAPFVSFLPLTNRVLQH